MKTQYMLLGIAGVLTTLSLVATNGIAQSSSNQQASQPEQDQIASDIAKTPGCQGVRNLETTDGMKIYFVWFENKKSALAWYESGFHQSALALVKESFPGQAIHKPLRHVKQKDGPILVVAALTHKDRAKAKPGEFPFTQLSMEMYKPLPGGMSFGGRFAPADVSIPKITEYTR